LCFIKQNLSSGVVLPFNAQIVFLCFRLLSTVASFNYVTGQIRNNHQFQILPEREKNVLKIQIARFFNAHITYKN
jgi:hypothetical protein